MDNSSLVWLVWFVFGILLIVAVVFTPGFVLLWFGIGALAAGFAAVVGVGSLAAQFVIFLLLSTVLTAASRTIFANFFVRDAEGNDLRTGAESLPGQIGIVVTDSAGGLRQGAVKVFGSTWTAYPINSEVVLKAGDQVIIERVEGASLYVRRVDALPAWRRDGLSG